MKKILLSIVVCMLIIGMTSSVGAVLYTGDPIEGNSWGQQFATDDQPNLVNLWSTQPFESATLPGDWTYWQSSDGYWAQYFTYEDYGQGNITLTQYWVSDKSTPLYLDAQEVSYDWDTGTIVASSNFGLYWNGSGWSYPDFGGAGGLEDCPGPVPIPTAVWLFGSGIVGLVGLRRKIRS